MVAVLVITYCYKELHLFFVSNHFIFYATPMSLKLAKNQAKAMQYPEADYTIINREATKGQTAEGINAVPLERFSKLLECLICIPKWDSSTKML